MKSTLKYRITKQFMDQITTVAENLTLEEAERRYDWLGRQPGNRYFAFRIRLMEEVAA